MPQPGVMAVGQMALLVRSNGIPSLQQRQSGLGLQGGSERRWRDLIGATFLYTAANWGAVAWYLEVYMRSTSAKALARLYDVTVAAEVTGSVITDDMALDGSTGYSRTRSGALTLADGHEYQIQFGVQDGGGGGALGAQLIAI